MNPLKLIIIIFENVVALAAFLMFFIGLIFYGMSFFEERMKFFVRLTRILSIIVTACTTLMMFTSIPKFVSYLSFVTNGIWCFVIFYKFPYISLIRPDFLLSVILSTFLFSVFLVYGIAYSEDTMFVYISYLFFNVLMIPLMATTCLSALDESTTNRTLEQERSIKNWIVRMFGKIGVKIPTHANKRE